MYNKIRALKYRWFDKKNFKTQTEEVLWLLENKRRVSAKDFSMVYGILRYGACIFKLRRLGYLIGMDENWVLKGKRRQRHTIYFLI